MQQQKQNTEHNISVTWRGKKFILEMDSAATLKELGHELQKLADVKADTMRLIVPQSSNKFPKLLLPFSDEHSALSLRDISFLEGKSIRMMGVPEVEVDEVLQNAKADLRIAGFEQEEKRLKQRMLDRPHTSLKLPHGQYIFCDFRTLHIPGLELNPPASEALKRMHMLAADPGIVSIMNKHRWRVGIMTELAPVGYVGVSPKCILGFNKNHGEEISLRLRTDDLKGFRKYESIKKTLLHELAHMVYSEHDANFYALDKQLNQEAASLDWTRTRSHTLSGVRNSEHYEEEFYVDSNSNSSHKLGGNTSVQLANARASSVAAAYRRVADASTNILTTLHVHEERDPDDSGFGTDEEPDHMEAVDKERMDIKNQNNAQLKCIDELDPDDCYNSQKKFEPYPDDTEGGETMDTEPHLESMENRISSESDHDDVEMTQIVPPLTTERKLAITESCQVPDPDDSQANGVSWAEPDPDDDLTPGQGISRIQTDELDPDDEELQRIQDPVTVFCSRLQKAIEMLRSEVNPLEAGTVLQTLFKIIRNVIENPDETKFKRLRKANPIIQRHVANYKAAMEILSLIGFHEDAVLDGIGNSETYLVLKRNDPGLLWLAKSSLETCIA
ncbi:uncharacterized protein LOC132308742 [Cornus florida]|uniref:uncharacterized protein LOC132308742 n=1 Tax=Cornus florida TaxID=4283 RepID=UPI002896D68F|nr:uncharacterized protein LOC132308742 [Cornus florida]